jgi:hypothetical protein
MAPKWTAFPHLLIFLLGLCFIPTSYGKTILIHAVGIDPVNTDQNYDEFYESAQRVLDYCRNVKDSSKLDCKVYLDTNLSQGSDSSSYKGETNKSSSFRNASEIKGGFNPGKILSAFESALKAAENDDQVVLSLSDHGATLNDGKDSCIYGGDQKICSSDINKILLQYKKPGVKVFISASGCFSGNFSSLSSKEVCTWVASDRRNSGVATNLGFASLLDFKRKGVPVSVSYLRKHDITDFLGYKGGGFSSQVFSGMLCKQPSAETSQLKEIEQLRNYAKKFFIAEDVKKTAEVLACSKDRDSMGKHLLDIYYLIDSIDRFVLGDRYDSNGPFGTKLVKNLQESMCNPPTAPTSVQCGKINAAASMIPKLSPVIEKLNGMRERVKIAYTNLANAGDSVPKEVALLSSPGSISSSSAKMGELLDQYLNAKKNEVQFIRATLDESAVVEYLELLNDIADLNCGKYLSNEDNPIPRLDRKITQEDLQDAKACEDSFVFP